MTAKPAPGCPACAERAPELHEDARGTQVYSIDLGWRLAVAVDKIDGKWTRVGQCHVIDSDGATCRGAAVTVGEIGKLLKAVEEIK